MTKEGAATVADDFRDRRQASSHCDLVSDELLPADLQQLSLTLVEGFKSFDVSGKKSPGYLAILIVLYHCCISNGGIANICLLHLHIVL